MFSPHRQQFVSQIFNFLRPNIRYDHQTDSKAFLICKSCFWCASQLNTRHVIISVCPGCDNNGLLNSIPISDNAVYEIDSSQKSKFTLEVDEYCTNERFEFTTAVSVEKESFVRTTC